MVLNSVVPVLHSIRARLKEDLWHGRSGTQNDPDEIVIHTKRIG